MTALLDSGIDRFIDLTEPGELQPMRRNAKERELARFIDLTEPGELQPYINVLETAGNPKAIPQVARNSRAVGVCQ